MLFTPCSFAILNPGKNDMSGKISMHERGRLARVYPLDPQELPDTYKELETIYKNLQVVPLIEGSNGLFRKIFPKL
jgi:hypothetical protein